jgi:hypothetical protein
MSRTATHQTTHTGHTSQPAKGATVTGVTQEKIAKRAYELWLKRGCKHGCDKQDWLDAEAEVKAETARSATSGKTTSSSYYR